MRLMMSPVGAHSSADDELLRKSDTGDPTTACVQVYNFSTSHHSVHAHVSLNRYPLSCFAFECSTCTLQEHKSLSSYDKLLTFFWYLFKRSREFFRSRTALSWSVTLAFPLFFLFDAKLPMATHARGVRLGNALCYNCDQHVRTTVCAQCGGACPHELTRAQSIPLPSYHRLPNREQLLLGYKVTRTENRGR